MSSAHPSRLSPLAKLGLDLGPLVVFFILLLRVDIFAATISYVVLAPIVLAVYWFMDRKIPPMVLVSMAMVVTFGGLTLWLHDDTFVKMKPTLLYLLFAGVLGAGLMVGRLFIKSLMESSLRMTDKGWRQLTLRMMIMFLVFALANELVWRNFSDAVWGGYKLASVLISLVAMAAILYSVSGEILHEDAPSGDEP